MSDDDLDAQYHRCRAAFARAVEQCANLHAHVKEAVTASRNQRFALQLQRRVRQRLKGERT